MPLFPRIYLHWWSNRLTKHPGATYLLYHLDGSDFFAAMYLPILNISQNRLIPNNGDPEEGNSHLDEITYVDVRAAIRIEMHINHRTLLQVLDNLIRTPSQSLFVSWAKAEICSSWQYLRPLPLSLQSGVANPSRKSAHSRMALRVWECMFMYQRNLQLPHRS